MPLLHAVVCAFGRSLKRHQSHDSWGVKRAGGHRVLIACTATFCIMTTLLAAKTNLKSPLDAPALQAPSASRLSKRHLKPDFYLNRELGSLAFNRRVLALAEDS